ncbi:MAG: hypothetical protein ABFE01_05010 [Phycisphaerales bacterium]|jgi:hypothetical protein
MITYQYEAYKPVRQIWTWLVILLMAVITLGWAMVTHMAITDVPRHWDFGEVADTPGKSAYATLRPPPKEPVPPQIELPPDYAAKNPAEPKSK